MNNLVKVLTGTAIAASAAGIILASIKGLPKAEQEKIDSFWRTETKRNEMPVADLENKKKLLANCMMMSTQNYYVDWEQACGKLQLPSGCSLPQEILKALDNSRNAANDNCKTLFPLTE
jgi:hypothetical protein